MTALSHASFQNRQSLALAIAVALGSAATVATAHAGAPIVADGTAQQAAAGDYSAGGDGAAGHVFHALNGGSISALGPVTLQASGTNTAAAMAESGSSITFQGGSVATTGDNAVGVSVGQDSRIDLLADGSGQGVSISTSGVRSHAARADAGTLNLDQAVLHTTGRVADGINASNGAQVQVSGGSIRTEGDQSNGVSVLNASAMLAGTQVETLSSGSDALLAQAGGRIEGVNLSLVTHGNGSAGATAHTGATLQLVDSQVQAHAEYAQGVRGGGTLILRNTDVWVGGMQARAIELSGGSLSMEGGLVRADDAWGMGLFLRSNGQAELTDTRFEVGSYGLNINGNGNTVRLTDVDIATHGDIGTGIWAPSASTLHMAGGSIHTLGTRGVAIDNRASDITLDGVRLSTQGEAAHAVYASMDTSSGRPRYQADRIEVNTTGEGAIGAVARLGGEITLRDSSIHTTGAKGYGVLSGGNGFLQLHNTTVRTEGLGAWAAVVNADGWLDIDGGALESRRHGALWVRTARQMTARNGARLVGGNGTLMAVDAGFAAPFEFSLDQDVYAQGDIVITQEDLDAGLPVLADIRVRLNGRSHWQGASTVVSQVSLSDASRWTLTGDSTVGQLGLADSTLALSTGDGRFNRLTVDGDFHASNSLLVFNGALAGDDAPVDYLHVRGNTAGSADIQVNNVHGLGAQTDNGIRLIQVDGVSGADYRLLGRAVAGRYDYFLHKGGVHSPGDGDWYLRSELGTHPPDPCEADPDGPGCGTLPPEPCAPGDDCGDPPVLPPDPCEADPTATDCGGPRPPQILRPEAGAYLANQAAAIGLFQHGLHDRNGEPALAGQGRGAWARVARNQADYGVIGNQLEVDSDSSVLQIGSDLLGWERDGQARLGVMLATGQANNQVRSALTGYAAKGKVDGNAIGLYGTWTQHTDASAGAYVDAWLQHGRYRNRVEGEGLHAERYRARSNAVSLEAGYAWQLHGSAASALYLQPQVQVGWTDYDSDRLTERNGTVVVTDQAGGLATRVGVRLYGHATAAGNRVQPFLAANWLREAGDNSLRFDGERLQGGVPENRYELKAGAQLTLGANWAAWGDLGVQRGDSGYRNVAGQIGLRRSW